MNKLTKILLAVVLVLLVVAIVIGGIVLYYQVNDSDKQQGTSGNVDSSATEWDDGLSAPSEIEGRILVPGYSAAKMEAGSTVLKLRIGNPEENNCYLKATLKLEDGTVLFESDLIEPGKGFDEITLTQTLEVGTYNAVVHYQGFSMDEEPQTLNSCDSAFTLNVTE